ncbi:hypothetical protein C4573_05730 [Candidatus Woesearchaeota archaeon]|nr:MAG: hypothetical protein C4573_05730 [Candidatus Woesearchaeota archaeon]
MTLESIVSITEQRLRTRLKEMAHLAGDEYLERVSETGDAESVIRHLAESDKAEFIITNFFLQLPYGPQITETLLKFKEHGDLFYAALDVVAAQLVHNPDIPASANLLAAHKIVTLLDQDAVYKMIEEFDPTYHEEVYVGLSDVAYYTEDAGAVAAVAQFLAETNADPESGFYGEDIMEVIADRAEKTEDAEMIKQTVELAKLYKGASYFFTTLMEHYTPKEKDGSYSYPAVFSSDEFINAANAFDNCSTGLVARALVKMAVVDEDLAKQTAQVALTYLDKQERTLEEALSMLTKTKDKFHDSYLTSRLAIALQNVHGRNAARRLWNFAKLEKDISDGNPTKLLHRVNSYIEH